MTNSAFNGRRLRLARTFSGLTQTDLAHRLDLAQAWVGQMEAGARVPSADRVDALGEVMRFRPRFFYGALVNEFNDGECHFRRRKTATAAAKLRAQSTGTLFLQVVDHLEQHVDFPDDIVPNFQVGSPAEIEAAADRCRVQWGLSSDRPVKSMTRAVENAGVVVTRAVSSDKVDAFSRGASGRKVIVVNEKKGATRTRFDIAHELGHLIMHRDIATGDEATEREANSFASAFLLPAAGFAREFPKYRIDWSQMLELKERWGVSLAAMVRRARDLGLISAVTYTSAYKYISWQNWLKEEPDEPELEQPEAVKHAFEALEDEGDPVTALADALHIEPEVILEIVGGVYRPPLPREPAPEPARDNVVAFDPAKRRLE
jgi:Zn-dependent peptidase ImmA (M78 family)/transcriptional regulator with XRE-family HTH domain